MCGRGLWTYVVAAVGVDGGEAFTLRRGLQVLPCFDLCQQLRVVAGGGHHVERFGACGQKRGAEK